MYFSNLFGIAICVFVLTRSKCTVQGCRDNIDTDCQQIKDKNLCGIYYFSKRCRRTCGDCIEKTPFTLAECRDVGTASFCQRVKHRCNQPRFGQAVSPIARYCRNTCGLCDPAQQQPLAKKENKCVDKPICERLTLFYNIKSCGTIRNKQLRRRAIKRCPKLCGVCVSETTEFIDPQVVIPKIKRPIVDEVENAKETVQTLTSRNRPPHPPIEDRENDEEPRRGVFYIITKYLSL